MNPEQLYDQAQQLLEKKQHDAAYKILRKLDATIPDHPGVLYLLAACQSLGGHKENAIKTYQRVLRLQPNFVEAMNNLGLDLKSLERHEEALACFDDALLRRPDFFDAELNKASTLIALHKYPAASELLAKLIAKSPKHPFVLANLGTVHLKTKNLDAALEHFEAARQILPDDPEICLGYLSTLHGLKGWELLVEAGNSMPSSHLEDDRVKKSLFTAYLQSCKWDETLKLLANSSSFLDPLDALCVTDDPKTILEACKKQSSHFKAKLFTDAAPRKLREKIKVGYMSSDFKTHPIAFLTKGIFSHHDKNLFEVHAIAIDQYPPIENKFRQQIANDSHAFHEIGHLSHRDATDFLKKLGLDILIDLNGHTKDSRTDLLNARSAEIQIQYLGFPGTMGANFIDYTVGDPTITPPEFFHGYSEKIITLPECFQANEDRRLVMKQNRSNYVILENSFVFACFNQPTKISRKLFDSWLRILDAIPNGMLWLAHANEFQTLNLVKHTENRGIDPNRLIFATRLPYEEHLGRYEFANLVLDTFPFNGGTTSSDALWGGAPVITVAGMAYSSRMTASLLHSVGLDELITKSPDAYEALAIELANNPIRLTELRKRLHTNLHLAPVFDTQRFVGHFETGLQMAAERARNGLKPDHLFVPLLNSQH